VVLRRRAKTTRAVPRFEHLTSAELDWRNRQLEVAHILAERYAADSAGLPSLAALDRVVAAWLDDDSSGVDINTVVNGIGIAFGQHLADLAQLDWVIAIDANGSDLALLGQPGDIVIFPANTIAKRLAAGQRGFIQELSAELLGAVEQRRSYPG
jgi:Domain of unknown function (DUF3806)